MSTGILASNRYVPRKRLMPTQSQLRSAITNGSQLFAGVDHRSASMRRFRDIIAAHTQDCGGERELSEGQRAIIRRAATMQLQLEMMEKKFAEREDAAASAREMEIYQRTSGALRRLLESLGLHHGRRARNVTPTLEHYTLEPAE
jgi:hypothetical protein